LRYTAGQLLTLFSNSWFINTNGGGDSIILIQPGPIINGSSTSATASFSKVMQAALYLMPISWCEE
jgi:uncharacterized membrane protein